MMSLMDRLRRFIRGPSSPYFTEDSAGSSLTLDEPWRKLCWGDKPRNLQYVQEYKPENADVKHLRILLYGPVGVGKSSFINSVSSIVLGRLSIPAAVNAAPRERSFTRSYQTHNLQEGRGTSKTLYSLVFNDIMGLEEGPNCGVHPDDIKLALKGHVMEGYQFNAESPLLEGRPGYNPTATADNRVHVVVCVVSANSSEIKASVVEKMSRIREAARDLGVPQMGLITNIDGACGEIDKDLRNVYKSKHLRKKMKDFSSAVGIPMNCIFPVKNYCDEIDLSDDVDTLILSALRNIINVGDDFIEKLQQ